MIILRGSCAPAHLFGELLLEALQEFDGIRSASVCCLLLARQPGPQAVQGVLKLSGGEGNRSGVGWGGAPRGERG